MTLQVTTVAKVGVNILLKAEAGGGPSLMGVVCVISGVLKVLKGAFDVKESKISHAQDNDSSVQKVDKQGALAFGAMNVVTGVVSIGSGLISLLKASFSVASLLTTIQTVTIALKSLGLASAVVSSISAFLTMIPTLIKSIEGRIFLRELKSKGVQYLNELYKDSPKRLKRLAPEVFTSMQGQQGVANEGLVQSASKEVRVSTDKNSAITVISLVAISAIVVVFLVSASAGVVVASIVGLALTLITTLIDIKSIIKNLKEAKVLEKKDLIILILTIVCTILSVVIACVFAPSILAGVVCGVMGVLVLTFPVGTLIYMKSKERTLKNNM